MHDAAIEDEVRGCCIKKNNNYTFPCFQRVDVKSCGKKRNSCSKVRKQKKKRTEISNKTYIFYIAYIAYKQREGKWNEIV